MNQLTVKVQDALGDALFNAAVDKDGTHKFLFGTAKSLVIVQPADDNLVRIISSANGKAFHKDFPAELLEGFSEDALITLFQTVVAFA